MNRRAFTMVELLLLLVLLCVVAIIGAPFFYDFDRIARENKTKEGLLKLQTHMALWQSDQRLRVQKGEQPLPADQWTQEASWTLGERPDNEIVHLGGIKVLNEFQRIQSCVDLQAVYLEGGYGWVFEPLKGNPDPTKGKIYAVTDDCTKSNPFGW